MNKIPIQGKFFITGTDTGVGKTTVTCHLLDALKQSNAKTLALKPIASGAKKTRYGLRNEDALKLRKHASIQMSYDKVNPFVFEPPIAPHLAAEQAGVELTVESIYQSCENVLKQKSDCLLIEGAGGWFVPLNKTETMADLVKRFNVPVIIVVGMRLGCLNHALLTIKAIEDAQLPIVGWFANSIEPDFPFLKENIQTLEEHIAYPLLGYLPFRAVLSVVCC